MPLRVLTGCCSSAIPAYSKRGDVIFWSVPRGGLVCPVAHPVSCSSDEAVSFPIQKGMLASRRSARAPWDLCCLLTSSRFVRQPCGDVPP